MPSPYKIILKPEAEKQFDKLSDGKRKAVYRKIRELQTNPAPVDSKELEGFAPWRRIAVDMVRIIYDPPTEDAPGYILLIGDRKKGVYDDLSSLNDEDATNGSGSGA